LAVYCLFRFYVSSNKLKPISIISNKDYFGFEGFFGF
jgi:hypothetical protein